MRYEKSDCLTEPNQYVGRWEITEKGMYDADKGKELTVEAIEDTLWKIPGYRNASRKEQIKLIRKHVLNFTNEQGNGALAYFHQHGLAGMFTKSPHLRKRSSPIAALELYDQERKLAL